MKNYMVGLAAFVSLLAVSNSQAATVSEKVKERGELRCGVGDPTPGWHSLDNNNRWVGFGVDFCRAVAAAVLGDAEKVAILPIGWAQSYEALRSGEIDIATTSHTYRIERDTGLQVNFPAVYLFSGITVMTRKENEIKQFSDLAGATICHISGSSDESTVAEWFRSRDLQFKALPFDTMTAVSEAYAKGRCDAFATEPALLAGYRSSYADPDDHVILPDLFSIDAAGPMVAEGDPQWDNIVRAVISATIAADQFGINSLNVDEQFELATSAEARRLLGKEGEHGKLLGLSESWARDLIKQVGSYSQIYDRNLGMKSPTKLEPGFNALVTDGGLLFSPHF
ncbi:amino acid ABC transporter substrate-binding protein (plasmid) [Ensifer adhaerens]|uniref:amino acid ABC transporter substrate-binding protein n=1 Tax=Ensifer adhaerens TaxID=106592 RepID=UPI000DE26A55|nr:amino acid ABC transporter substrate-binding protein [Ensifer adhaerens]MBZ7927347.1 amino acid ABC transporter substrate-binding protein [Ensifer adhaerens]UAX98354.1 amino acid ABC transporter substrate-binding protein [Ensifer adhaerens]UAY05737.1 amino acid ABC transporter substrate-binding protein [Ensifer adhaerens]UAY13115.1 amino acid ABC transporter substrate-binding protein [Ensifer adhaerens]